jgi:nucleoside-diphosphate-sugar epimerase
MNILVAGAAGFIGSNLCKRLLGEGHTVYAADNFLTGERENIALLSENPHFTFFEGGIETEAFMKFIQGAGVTFDRVYDLACPTGVPNIETLGEEMLVACSDGTRNMLRIAHEHNARFLVTSSSEIYGAPLVSPQSEGYAGNVDPIGWRANYEEGKRFAETWTELYVRKYGLKAVIVRLFNTYGPQMSAADFRVIPRFATQALAGKDLTVHGEGAQTRTLCYIDDTLAGICLAMEKGEAGEAYNIGGDEPITMRSLAELIIDASGTSSVLTFTPRAAHDHESRMPLLEKIRALGWKQTIGLEEGIAHTLVYFKNKGAGTK